MKGEFLTQVNVGFGANGDLELSQETRIHTLCLFSLQRQNGIMASFLNAVRNLASPFFLFFKIKTKFEKIEVMICRLMSDQSCPFFSLRTDFSPDFSNNLLVYNMYIFLYILGSGKP